MNPSNFSTYSYWDLYILIQLLVYLRLVTKLPVSMTLSVFHFLSHSLFFPHPLSLSFILSLSLFLCFCLSLAHSFIRVYKHGYSKTECYKRQHTHNNVHTYEITFYLLIHVWKGPTLTTLENKKLRFLIFFSLIVIFVGSVSHWMFAYCFCFFFSIDLTFRLSYWKRIVQSLTCLLTLFT